jgi:hypothetical protein
VAQYTGDPADVDLPAPWGERGAVFWQFTAHGNGQMYGVESLGIDLNLFNGTLEQFRSFFNLANGGDMTQVIQGVAKTNVLMRIGPGTGYPTAEWNGKNYIPAGATIEAVYPNQAQWLKIVKINGAPVGLDVYASAGTSQQYIGWEVVTVAEEPPTDPPVNKTPFTLSVDGYKPFSGELEAL